MKKLIFNLIVLSLIALNGSTAYHLNSDENYVQHALELKAESDVFEADAASYLSSFLRNQGHCEEVASTVEINRIRDEIIDNFSIITKLLTAATNNAVSDDEREVVSMTSNKVAKIELEILKELDVSSSSLCFSCSKFVSELNKEVQSMVQTIEERFPGVKEQVWFRTVMTFVNAVISVLSEICPNDTVLIQTNDMYYLSPVELLFKSKKSCLTKEQRDDVEEVLQLAGNLLNTFSEWLRESEQKAKSRELKYVLERAAVFLDKERELIEGHGENLIEKGCERCASLVKFVSEVTNLGETAIKTVVPFWKSIPQLEECLDRIDSFLAKAREVCPYEYVKAGLSELSLSSFTCTSENTEFSVHHVVRSFENFIDLLELEVEGYAMSLKQLARAEINQIGMTFVQAQLPALKQSFRKDLSKVCLSCKDIVRTIDGYLNELEGLLDENFPSWRKLPLVDLFDNFVHDVITHLANNCPSSQFVFSKHSKQALAGTCLSGDAEFEVKQLARYVTKQIETLETLLVLFKDNVAAVDIQEATKELLSILIKLELYIQDGTLWAANESCFICDFALKQLDIVIDLLKEVKENVHLKQLDFLVGLVEDTAKRVRRLVRRICDRDDELTQIESNKALLQPMEELLESLLQVADKLEVQVRPASNLRSSPAFLLDFTKFSCKDFVSEIENIVTQIEEALSKILPGWDQLPLIPELDDFIHKVLDTLRNRCPSNMRTVLNMPLIAKAREAKVMKKGCLTKLQQEKLQNITMEAKLGLDIVGNVLEIKAEFEPNPLKKFTYQEASKVIHVFAAEVVTNMTRLADEFCGSCADLTQAVADVFQVLEDALFDIEPMWKSTPVYEGVKKITSKVFEDVESLCGTKTGMVQMATKENHCLTPEQTATFKGYIASIDGVFTYAANTLDSLANSVGDESLQQEMKDSATALRAVDRDLVDNFTKIADETCGTCLDIMHGLKDFESAVEKALTDVDADWRNNPKYAGVDAAVSTVISLIERFCPSNGDFMNENRFLENISVLRHRAEMFPFEDTKQAKFMDRKLLLQWLASVKVSLLNDRLKVQEHEHSVVELAVRAIFAQTESSIDRVSKDLSAKFEYARDLEVLRDMFFLLEESIAERVVNLDNIGIHCGFFVDALDGVIHEVKILIEDMVPGTKNSNIFNEAVNLIEQVLDMLHAYCPDRV